MEKKTYRIIICLIVAAIIVTLSVFFVQTNVTNRTLKVTLVVKSQQTGFEFWEMVRKGAQEGAKEFNVALTIDGPMSEEDIDEQIAIMEHAIAEKPDAIILAAVDQERLLPYAKQAKEQGIKLIMVDSDLSEPVADCFVGTNNYNAAQNVGAKMGEAMDGQGKIAVISHQMSTATAEQRISGFRYAMRNFPQIEVVGEYDIGDSVSRSKERTMRLLAENPDIAGIFATNQISAEGVTAALRELERTDIAFYAFDSSTTQNEALEQGVIDGFAVQMPFNMGYMSVKAAVDAYMGTLRKSTIDTGFAYATKENIREEEIQKLIYPFV